MSAAKPVAQPPRENSAAGGTRERGETRNAGTPSLVGEDLEHVVRRDNVHPRGARVAARRVRLAGQEHQARRPAERPGRHGVGDPVAQLLPSAEAGQLHAGVVADGVLPAGALLLGALLRVRAFLFLGVTFLSLDVFAQIRHAAVGRASPGPGGRRASCSARRS